MLQVVVAPVRRLANTISSAGALSVLRSQPITTITITPPVLKPAAGRSRSWWKLTPEQQVLMEKVRQRIEAEGLTAHLRAVVGPVEQPGSPTERGTGRK